MDRDIEGVPWNLGQQLGGVMDRDIEVLVDNNLCHCGNQIYYHDDISIDGKFSIEPILLKKDMFTRGLCEHCDSVRCDAYPGACRDNFDGKAFI